MREDVWPFWHVSGMWGNWHAMDMEPMIRSTGSIQENSTWRGDLHWYCRDIRIPKIFISSINTALRWRSGFKLHLCKLSQERVQTSSTNHCMEYVLLQVSIDAQQCMTFEKQLQYSNNEFFWDKFSKEFTNKVWNL